LHGILAFQGNCHVFKPRSLRERFLPVRDELLGEIYRANANGLTQLVESVSSEVRPCWRCSAIAEPSAFAGGVDRRKLQRTRADQLGGRVGSALYALSGSPRRAPHRRCPTATQADHTVDQPLSTFQPIEDELDDELEAVTA